MGILDPLFSLRQFALFSHAEASLGSRRLRREKKKARVGTPFPLSNVPRASTIIIFLIIVFFVSCNPWGSLCLGERKSYVHYFVFLYTWFTSIMKRSCCADGGVAGESRLHSELFSTNQGYWYTKLHNRNERQWNIEITCCSFWTWRTWGSQW